MKLHHIDVLMRAVWGKKSRKIPEKREFLAGMLTSRSEYSI
jgi:hypothetical protein